MNHELEFTAFDAFYIDHHLLQIFKNFSPKGAINSGLEVYHLQTFKLSNTQVMRSYRI